jgi:hypothetical protein
MATAPVHNLPTGTISGNITWSSAIWSPDPLTTAVVGQQIAIDASIQISGSDSSTLPSTEKVATGQVISVAHSKFSHNDPRAHVEYTAGYEIRALQLVTPEQVIVTVNVGSAFGATTAKPVGGSNFVPTSKSQPNTQLNFTIN